MNVFSRLFELLVSHTHLLLDRAENMEALSAHILREMDNEFDKTRRAAVAIIGARRRLERGLEQNRREVEQWHNRAREAMSQGREDLVRKALVIKRTYQDLVRALEVQTEEMREASNSVKTALSELEQRMAEVRCRQQIWKSRYQAARARNSQWPRDGGSFPSARTSWSRMENHLLDLEERCLGEEELRRSEVSVAEEFRDMAVDQEMEKEIAELREMSAKVESVPSE